jgi:hypothetical protein
LREISIQFTGGTGAKTYINSTFIYLYSLIAEIWFNIATLKYTKF